MIFLSFLILLTSPRMSTPLLAEGTAVNSQSLHVPIVTQQYPSPLRDRQGGPPSSTPLTLLKNGVIYTPEYLGVSDILIGGTKILAINKQIDVGGLAAITTVIDCTGFVDMHVHVTGGGGESGPASRTPEAQLDQVINGGITTLVGLLGTDGVSRTLPNLLTKLKSFELQGLTSYMWSGNYHVPPPTLTQTYSTDILLIDKIIGFGEIAIADHRSSVPTTQEIARLVADGRVAGLLSGKPGVTYFHVGSGKSKIDQLFSIVQDTDIPITQMIPTHMSSRGEALLEEGFRWLKAGGRIDFTADSDNETDTTNALLRLQALGLSLANVSISSDAYGSLPVFDSAGRLIQYDYQRPDVLYKTLRTMVLKYGWAVEKILPLLTSNPASFLSLPKGELKVGRDADILAIHQSTFTISYVMGKGEILKTPEWVKPAMFECV